jgi:hypothetical protein
MRLSVTPIKRVAPRFGFKTSIIALWRSELSADRIGSQQGARRGGREGLEYRGHEEGLEPHLSKGIQGSMTRISRTNL